MASHADGTSGQPEPDDQRVVSDGSIARGVLPLAGFLGMGDTPFSVSWKALTRVPDTHDGTPLPEARGEAGRKDAPPRRSTDDA